MTKPRLFVRRPSEVLPSPQFADPWAFRRVSAGRIEPAAGVDGRPTKTAPVRHNGRLVHTASFTDPLIPEPASPPERSMVSELRRRRAKLIAQYRLSGLFSAEDMSLIEAILNGQSQSEWARRQPVAPSRQAACERLHRLKSRAPFIWEAWHRTRRMRRRG